MMSLRSQRFSDLVIAICIPITMVMYLHMMLLAPTSPLQDIPHYTETIASDDIARSSQGGDSVPEAKTVTPASVKVGPPLNLTGNARQDLLLMTPLLRCGATSIRNLLKLMQRDNDFQLVLNPPKKSEVIHIPISKAQNEIVAKISEAKTPTAVLQSFAFINFTDYNLSKPIHISLVREPVDRAISWFYHVRAPFQLVERHNKFPEMKFPSRAFLKKDLETCLKDRHDPECRYTPGREKLGHTIEFFCGHEPFCPIFGSPEGLQRAKEVVEKEFAVVGILEEWPKTLAVLEHYIPRYFKGATKKYYERMHGDKTQLNENFYRPHVEPKAKQFLGRNFTIEEEFYDYLKERLNRQYDAIQLNN